MSEEGESGAKSDSEAPKPGYHRVVTDMHFVNISIKTYEKKTGGGFPREEYFAYRIVSILTSEEIPEGEAAATHTLDETKKKRQEVWRRYSEFEILWNFLCTVYPYVVVPPLPEKAIKGSSGLLNRITFSTEDSDFLIKRQHALEIFLVRLSRHPVLRQSYWFHQFLENIGWREAVQRTGYLQKSDMLLKTLSLLSKQKGDQRFQDVREYADELEAIFKSLLEIREKVNGSVKAVYKIHANYGRVLSEWSEIEDTIGTALQVAGGSMDSYADSVEMYLDEEESRYYMPLKEYLAYCESLRGMVKRHDLLEKRLERAESTLSTKSETKATVQREGLPSGVEQAGAPPTGATPTSGGGRFSLRAISNRLRGVDDSYEGRLAVASRELLEAEETVRVTQKELQLVHIMALVNNIRQPIYDT
jgi:sorting nexin-4